VFNRIFPEGETEGDNSFTPDRDAVAEVAEKYGLGDAVEPEGGAPRPAEGDDAPPAEEPAKPTEPDPEKPQTVMVDGEEVSLEQGEEWKHGHLRQEDYNKGKNEVRAREDELREKELDLVRREGRLENLPDPEDPDDEDLSPESLRLKKIEDELAERREQDHQRELDDRRGRVIGAYEGRLDELYEEHGVTDKDAREFIDFSIRGRDPDDSDIPRLIESVDAEFKRAHAFLQNHGKRAVDAKLKALKEAPSPPAPGSTAGTVGLDEKPRQPSSFDDDDAAEKVTQRLRDGGFTSGG
jgi:hypothetical protein